MAGSIKGFLYTTDTGGTFGVRMDEDWGELVSNSDIATDPSNVYGIPINLTPRYALYRSSTGNRQLSIIVCDPEANSSTVPQTITISSSNGEVSETAGDNTLVITSFKGEVYQPIKAVDTGLVDGDAT